MPTSSVALAETVTVPLIVALASGAVTLVVGAAMPCKSGGQYQDRQLQPGLSHDQG